MSETHISAPHIERRPDGNVRIVSKITSPCGESKNLWYQTTADQCSDLVWERADAFLVGLIPYIARNGGKVVSEAPVSAHLLHNLRNLLSPILPSFHPALAPIDIKADADSSFLNNANRQHVGTGCSCGIDSMATLAVYTEDNTPPSLRVDTLAFFDVGSHGDRTERPSLQNSKCDALSAGRMSHMERFAKKIRTPLVKVSSNISDFSGGFSHVAIHTFRSMSAVLAMQKAFSAYHYASGYPITEFKITSEGIAYADEFILRCLSTESTRLYSSLASLNRQDRTYIVSNYEPSYEFLNVCVRDETNCGLCFKCARTMFQLDVLGKLDLFSKVFNISAYRQNSRKILRLLSKDSHFHSEFLSAAANSGNCPYSLSQLKFAFAAGNISQTLVRFRKQLTRRYHG